MFSVITPYISWDSVREAEYTHTQLQLYMCLCVCIYIQTIIIICNYMQKWFCGQKLHIYLMTNLDSILKSRDIYFANKGQSSQGYGFSSSHVWM